MKKTNDFYVKFNNNNTNIVFFGDSLCSADCERENKQYKNIRGYAGRIGKNLNLITINVAHSGSSFSTCRKGNRIINQLDTLDLEKNVDLIILEGGVNDAWDCANLGSINIKFSNYEDYNQDTFCGGFEATLHKIKQFFPKTIIGFVIPYHMPNAIRDWGITSLSDDNLIKYYNLAIKICEKWGIPYLNLYDDKEFNFDIFQVSKNINLLDGVHPNSLGYDILGNVIGKWIIKTFKNN